MDPDHIVEAGALTGRIFENPTPYFGSYPLFCKSYPVMSFPQNVRTQLCVDRKTLTAEEELWREPHAGENATHTIQSTVDKLVGHPRHAS